MAIKTIPSKSQCRRDLMKIHLISGQIQTELRELLQRSCLKMMICKRFLSTRIMTTSPFEYEKLRRILLNLLYNRSCRSLNIILWRIHRSLILRTLGRFHSCFIKTTMKRSKDGWNC
ncbi:unnamed protein product [Moneuplotes crassus]|uniref:Uncharacterized protein n=1 Tax=Euplotes crassus TaxID=5936 RepID=A0AAD1XIL3_EUPCR|nr:unnamed protein product [Moneuplotes crassus]